jgi:vacuolar-type H+-ATPase catalytic subunit A/Vma1
MDKLTHEQLQILRNLGNEAEAAADEIERLREALMEIRDRIKGHPAYADLTMEQEIDEGGDTAEFSYLARVADAALGA